MGANENVTFGTDHGSAGGGGRRRNGFLWREALDIGALLLAGGAAHLLVISLGHSEGGGALLIALGTTLVLMASAHRWRSHRRHAASAPVPAQRRAPGVPPAERLWRVRVAIDDLPGGLAALTGQMAELGVDIRLVQVHPGAGEAVDDFYLTAPSDVGPDALRGAVVRAGGRTPLVETADVRELSDGTSRALSLAASVATGNARLPEALSLLCGADAAACEPVAPDGLAAEGLSGTAMCLPSADGGVIVLHRAQIPFTAIEFARCRAFIDAVSATNSATRPA